MKPSGSRIANARSDNALQALRINPDWASKCLIQ